MRFVRILKVWSLVFLCGAAHAETEILRISSGDYAPFADQSAPDGGIVNARIHEIAEQAGFEVEFEYMPWMRGLELTRIGRYAGASYWFYREEREADFIHVGPVVADQMVLFRRVDTDLPEWTDVQDLREMTFGAVTGYTYTPDFWDLAEAGVLSVQTAQNDEANFRKLLAGRIDIYPMSAEVGVRLIEKVLTPAERAQIAYETQPLMVTEGFLLISRKTDDAEEIAARLQSIIDDTNLVVQGSGG